MSNTRNLAGLLNSSGFVPLPTKVAGVLPDANAPSGSVIQVVSTTKTDTFSSGSNGTFDITGLSAVITPSSTSSKILVFVKVNVGNSGAQNTSFTLQLYRGATLINAGDAAGSRIRGFAGSEEGISDGSFGQYQTYDFSTTFLDSPSSTSSLTYKVSVVLSQINVFYVNRTASDGDTAAFSRNTSNITLMEIAA
jgi:hypothetical protein